MNYRVRTLHGLAHDIVRERPDLVGLSDRFEIIDDATPTAFWMMQPKPGCATTRYFTNCMRLIFPTHHDNPKYYKNWHDTVMNVAGSFIRLSKDLQMLPEDLKPRLDALQDPPLLLRMGYEIYRDYQRALQYRSAVDFDDLIAWRCTPCKPTAAF
jgi:DNA helicase-2/ATP-dependent DNA helicase PcrA